MIQKHLAYCLFFALALCATLALGQQRAQFHHINEGMSLKNVHSIAQDSLGYLWISTRNGLHRYNGSEIKVYQHKPKDSTSISHNYIYKIFNDRQGTLWICTANGVDKYSAEFDNFIHVPVSTEVHEHNSFVDMEQDDQGSYWFCSQNGLYGLDSSDTEINSKYFKDLPIASIFKDQNNQLWLPAATEVILLNIERQKHFSVYSQQVGTQDFDFREVAQDMNGNLWATSWNQGVFRVVEGEKGNVFLTKTSDKEGFPAETAKSIQVDRNNNLWIGTESFGLYKYNITEQKISHYYTALQDPTSLSSNGIWTTYQDRDGRIWIGTYDKGVDVLDPFRDKFSLQRHNPSHVNSLSVNSVVSFLVGVDSTYWIGTDGGGLNKWDQNKGNYARHFYDPNQIGQGTNITFLDLENDTEGFIWGATWGEGLIAVDSSGQAVRKFKHDENDPESIAGDRLFSIAPDPAHPNNFWVAVWQEGLDYFDNSRGVFTHYEPEPSDPRKMHRSSLRNDEFFDLQIDQEGNLWLAGTAGVERVTIQENGKFNVRLYQNTSTELVLSDNNASTVFVDHQNQIWVCTNNGLDLYQPDTDDFLHFTVENGLVGNIVAAIEEEGAGIYWVSTDKGLNKMVFDPMRPTELLHIKHFDTDNGLQKGAFNERASLKSSSGELLFGGLGGFNIFHPDSVFNNPLIPKVYFTGFKIFNQLIKPRDGSGIIDKDISLVKSIELSHEEDVFTFEFIGVSFTNAKKMSYAYKMVGFDKQWNHVGNRHEATYTSLNPGAYIFQVKVANSDGLWSDELATINIIIHPPWWETWWFRVIAIMVALTILTVIYKVRVNLLERQKDQLKKLVDQRTDEVVRKNELLNLTNDSLKGANEELLSHQKALEVAYEELDRNNKEVRASIKYASYIQNAMLDSTQLLQETFPSSFILLKPRDVVSGDFYWFKRVKDKVVICASDCTGHGVPGALMSMLGMNLLNQIVGSGVLDAAEILDQLHAGVYQALSQEHTENRDGMDISLVVVDTKKKQLHFAGANNPLAIVLDGGFELIKPDRMPIGGKAEDAGFKKFSKRKVSFAGCEQAAIYLFSDGFQDQFGGASGRKFMVRKFYNLLAESEAVPMTNRGQFLDEQLIKWQGKEPQVDDILVMGIDLNT